MSTISLKMIPADDGFSSPENEGFFHDDSWDNIVRETQKNKFVAKTESGIRPTTLEPKRRSSRRSSVVNTHTSMDVFGTEFRDADPWAEDKDKAAQIVIDSTLENCEGETHTPTLNGDTNANFPVDVWEAGTDINNDKNKSSTIARTEKGRGDTTTRSSSRGRRPRRESGCASENDTLSSFKVLDERPSRFLTSEEVSSKRRSHSKSNGPGARRNSLGRRGRSKSVQRTTTEIVNTQDSRQRDRSSSTQRRTREAGDPKDPHRRDRSSSTQRRTREAGDPKDPHKRDRSSLVQKKTSEAVATKQSRRRSGRSSSVSRGTREAGDPKDPHRRSRSSSVQRRATEAVETKQSRRNSGQSTSSVQRTTIKASDPKDPHRRSRSSSVQRRIPGAVETKQSRRHSDRSSSVQRTTTKASDSKDQRRRGSLQRTTTSVVDPRGAPKLAVSPSPDTLVPAVAKKKHGRRNSRRMKEVIECQMKEAQVPSNFRTIRNDNAVGEGSPASHKKSSPHSREQQQHSRAPGGRGSRSLTSSGGTPKPKDVFFPYRSNSDDLPDEPRIYRVNSKAKLRRSNVKSALNKVLSGDDTDQPFETPGSSPRALPVASASPSGMNPSVNPSVNSSVNSSVGARLQQSIPELSNRSIASAPEAQTGSSSCSHRSATRRGTRNSARSKSQSSVRRSRQRTGTGSNSSATDR
eukprot:jgi/Psemu1/284578/fgenesh1_pg.57_\